MMPEVNPECIDEKAEERMDLLRDVVSLGRGAREKAKLKVRQPLSKIMLDSKYEELISDLTPLVMEELNVKSVEFDDISKYMKYNLKPDFKAAGPALGSKVKAFGAALAKVDAKEFMAEAEDGAMLDIDGEMVKITKDLVDLRIEGEDGYSVGMDGGVAVAISTELTPELVDEGFAREIISKVQQMRKQQNFEMMDNITISIACDDEVAAAAEKHKEYIMTETLATELNVAAGEGNVKINGHKAGIVVERV